jgi:hypothetical protein
MDVVAIAKLRLNLCRQRSLVSRFTLATETLEHLRRKVDGGTHRNDNIALACLECNTGRGSMDWLSYTTYRRGEFLEAAE